MNTREEKTPVWRNVRVLGWVFQLGVLALVGAIGAYLFSNLTSQQGNPFTFDFLQQPSSFTIPANDFRSSQPVWQAVYEGLLNTLRVVVVGLALATILGIALGFGRLSKNFLLRAVCTIYIEVVRNIPLLGILLFAYLALVLQAFPAVADAVDVAGMVIVSNRGMSIPWYSGSIFGLLAAFVVAALVAYGIRRWRLAAAERKDEPAHLGLWVGVSFPLVFFWVAFFSGIGFTSPSLDGRNISGGMTMQPEYFALLFALVVYTASHIGEIIRGSILAVDKGQVEASHAMALNGWQRMRYVVFPQALRVAMPALGNQYLNLMKNSSLGFAVSYFELTKTIATTVGNRSPAVPSFTVLLVVYLMLSLFISALVNVANRRLEVAGR